MRVVQDSEADTDCSVKVAFATSDMRHVDQHFGAAQSFALYAVDPTQTTLLEATQFGKLAQDGNEDKLAVKIAMLQGCAAVFCQAVGASAVRQLLAGGVQPVKVSEGADIKDLLESLQQQMREGPSAWLAQAIQRQSAPDMTRFDAMESEGWEE
ncbi:MAG: NifB/NifX family molybdenum-iron cluster-binding protein [Gammaproteobacteria bacterium]